MSEQTSSDNQFKENTMTPETERRIFGIPITRLNDRDLTPEERRHVASELIDVMFRIGITNDHDWHPPFEQLELLAGHIQTQARDEENQARMNYLLAAEEPRHAEKESRSCAPPGEETRQVRRLDRSDRRILRLSVPLK